MWCDAKAEKSPESRKRDWKACATVLWTDSGPAPHLFVVFARAFVIGLSAEPTPFTNMKMQHRIILATVLAISVLASHGQPGGVGGPPPGPSMSGRMKKVFGEHTAFSANLEMQYQGESSSDAMIMPGKMAVLDGKSRFEMDMTQMKGGQLTPASAAQMKQMGMGSMTAISRPDKKLNYMVYPGLQAYLENAMRDPDADKPDSDFKVEVTELGKETVDGHPCVKNKVIVTDKEAKKHEF